MDNAQAVSAKGGGCFCRPQADYPLPQSVKAPAMIAVVGTVSAEIITVPVITTPNLLIIRS